MKGFTALLVMLTVIGTEASHFRGASFSWSPKDNSSIDIRFRISWRRSYGSQYQCDDSTKASGSLIGDSNLVCVSGCSGNVGSLMFQCTDYSVTEDWTTGVNTITYTTTSEKFSFAFTGGAWITLQEGGGSSWSLMSTVDLVKRADNGKINSSPTVDVPPFQNWQFGCSYRFYLPVADIDGDVVRCRWAVGKDECADVCQTLSDAVLDEKSCILSYTANKSIGYYAVALQIEDFATAESTVPLSSIPLQFLVRVYHGTTSDCGAAPLFISPTPDANTDYQVFVGDSFIVTIRAKSSVVLSTVTTTTAIGMVRSSEVSSKDENLNYITLNVTWEPSVTDAEEDKTLCFYVTDVNGVSGETRCIKISVSNINECESNPCENGATCSDRVKKYSCLCLEGYEGDRCEIEIDECSSSPCQNGATCIDLVNGYNCLCVDGFDGVTCEHDIDECLSSPCQNGATCHDNINRYTCSCSPGYDGVTCTNDIDECNSDPCKNGGLCIDEINGYTCICKVGYDGAHCEEELDECRSSPCQNGGTCTDSINGFICTCVRGYDGFLCDKDINECRSNPCAKDATCIDMVNGYTCTGNAGSSTAVTANVLDTKAGRGRLVLDLGRNDGQSRSFMITLLDCCTCKQSEQNGPNDTGLSDEELDQLMYEYRETTRYNVAMFREWYKNFDSLPSEVKIIIVTLLNKIGNSEFSIFTKMTDALRFNNWISAAEKIKESRWYTTEPAFAEKLVERMKDVSIAEIGASLLQLIRSEIILDKGRRLEVYRKGNDTMAFGIGHVINVLDPEYGLLEGTAVSRERVESAFETDFLQAVKDAIGFNPDFNLLPNPVKRILINMAFDLGRPRLYALREFRKALRYRKWRHAAEEMVKDEWYKQEASRSKRLVKLMISVSEYK